MVLHDKTINKTWLTKNQENSANSFVDNYLTNHLAKLLQDRIKKPRRVGALRVWTGITFLKKVVSDSLLTSFNFSPGSC